MLGSKNYREFFKIPFKDIYGYANTLYGMETLKWNFDPNLKPNEKRCFKIKAKILSVMSKVYFCIYKDRTDWGEKYPDIPESGALYLNDLWVAMFNQKLLKYNLKEVQEKTLRAVTTIDCNSHTMEPIKYTFRIKVSISF